MLAIYRHARVQVWRPGKTSDVTKNFKELMLA